MGVMKGNPAVANEQERHKILSSLPEAARLLLDIEALKDVERQNPNVNGVRRELVAEHSWFVAIGVVLLAEFSPEKIDIARAVLLATVHDVVEAFVGDTFAFGAEVSTQHGREHGAMAELRVKYRGNMAVERLVDLWEEYENQETPEAKFVKGIDAFSPIVLNYSNIEQSSWLLHQVEGAKVFKRLARAEGVLGELAEINKSMIAQAIEDGYLK
jgi:putative hydrolase of HD superfamily